MLIPRNKKSSVLRNSEKAYEHARPASLGRGVSRTLRRLMETRSVLPKMLQSPNIDQEIMAWVKRHGSAEGIQLNDFGTGRDFRPSAAGQERRYFVGTT
jgi:hypothetical protein